MKTEKPVLRFPNLPEVKVRGEAPDEPILWLGLQWAVTPYGVEARDGTYAIDWPRLWDDGVGGGWSWEKQLGAKNWVDRHDAAAALTWARNHFADRRPL